MPVRFSILQSSQIVVELKGLKVVTKTLKENNMVLTSYGVHSIVGSASVKFNQRDEFDRAVILYMFGTNINLLLQREMRTTNFKCNNKNFKIKLKHFHSIKLNHYYTQKQNNHLKCL